MLRVMNSNLEIIDKIREYTFSQYTIKYNDFGSFEVLAKLVEENMFLFKEQQYYIVFEKYVFGKVEKISKDSDSEYEKTISITGRLAPIILSQRVIDKTISFSGKPNQYIKELVKHCFSLDKKESKRYLNINIIDNVQTELEDIEKQITGGQLSDEVFDILKQNKLGLFVFPNITKTFENENGKTNVDFWNFVLTSGNDRRIKNESGNTPIVFSQSYSNIKRTSYEKNIENYKNVAIVAGEGESSNRKWYVVEINSESEESGLNRDELWIDARDIQSNQNGTKISDIEYEKLIIKRANEKAEENNISKSYQSTVNEKKYKFGEDYTIGDFVTVKDDELKVVLDAQVTGVTVTEQNSSKIYDIMLEYGTIEDDVKKQISDTKKASVENKTEIKYLIGEVKKTKERVKQGSYIIRNVTGTSAVLFTMSQLNDIFGVEEKESNCYLVNVMNGDGNATGAHFNGTTWIGDNCYVVFDRSLSNAQIRINFVVHYSQVDELLKNY